MEFPRIVDPENTLLTFSDRSGRSYSIICRYDQSSNNIFPPVGLTPFNEIAEKLGKGDIVNFNENLYFSRSSPENTILIFVDKAFVIYETAVKWDRKNNQILSPELLSFDETSALISSGQIIGFKNEINRQGKLIISIDKSGQINQSILNEPTVTCIKGHIHEYGASLENAPNLLYIGRNLNMGGWRLPKSKWANPFTVKEYGREGALQKYQEYILNNPQLLNSLPELTGKVLACWCQPPDPCHGDILVELYRRYVK